MHKKALRYHRFSNKDQSNGSIERQDMITGNWCLQNTVTSIDTFIDDGYSAKTFDRPDVKKLFEFITAQTEKLDYLIVAELSRFSRELGEAVTMVRKIQITYGIKIVSAGRNTIYDVTDHASFFMMSIEFTLGNTENLKRESDINGGIYAAKTKEQRFIGSRAPYGYRKQGERIKELIIHETEAVVVRMIYHEYLSGTPLLMIYKAARENGFSIKGNSAIQKILTNPIYSGQQLVKPWKDLPGGIFPAKHEPVIDIITWNQVQHKMKAPKRPVISMSDDFPLRNVLHCHCGRLYTGAPSKGKLGKYYNYYKCNTSGCKSNLSATKAHEKLLQVLELLSLPAYITAAIKKESYCLMDKQLAENKLALTEHKRLYEANDKKIVSLEEKYITNQIAFETYNRWFTDLQSQRTYLKAKIDELSAGHNETLFLLDNNLELLHDLKYLYHSAATTQKQQLINTVFDNRLYYRSGTYRTPYIMQLFTHNLFTLKEKHLLVLDEKRGNRGFSPEVELQGAISKPTGTDGLIHLMHIVNTIRVA